MVKPKKSENDNKKAQKTAKTVNETVNKIQGMKDTREFMLTVSFLFNQQKHRAFNTMLLENIKSILDLLRNYFLSQSNHSTRLRDLIPS